MVVDEFSLTPAILGVMLGSIVFVAALMLAVNQRVYGRLTFSFLQLLIFVTISAFICFVANILINVETDYESKATIRHSENQYYE